MKNIITHLKILRNVSRFITRVERECRNSYQLVNNQMHNSTCACTFARVYQYNYTRMRIFAPGLLLGRFNKGAPRDTVRDKCMQLFNGLIIRMGR